MTNLGTKTVLYPTSVLNGSFVAFSWFSDQSGGDAGDCNTNEISLSRVTCSICGEQYIFFAVLVIVVFMS